MTTIRHSVSEGSLLGTNEVLVADECLTVEEQATLLAWADDQYRQGKLLENPRDPGAFTTPFRSATRALTNLTSATARRSSAGAALVWVPEVEDPLDVVPPEEFWRVRQRVVDLLGLHELQEDTYKGSFLSYIAPGAGIHRHRDATLMVDGNEKLILRCNVLLKRPLTGGLPVLESTEIDVPDRGMWGFYPTEVFHSASRVGGSEFRGLLSFGFLVGRDHLWQRNFMVASALEREYGLSDHASRSTLVEQLRKNAADQGVDEMQIGLLEFALLTGGSFSVHDAARAVGRDPSMTLDALQGLQRTGVVDSRSSTSFTRGSVTVL